MDNCETPLAAFRNKAATHKAWRRDPNQTETGINV